VLAEIVDRIFEDPARSGGLMVVALTATAIICNGLFLQHAQRPAPLFPSRGVTDTTAVPVPLPNPAPALHVDAPAASSAARSPAATLAPPLPRLSPRAAPVPTPKTIPVVQPAAPPAPTQAVVPAASQPTAALITEIERGLARLGIYTGPIDGKPGKRVSAAIAKYEEAAGEAVTGQPTPELLYALQHPQTAPAIKQPTDAIAAQLNQAAQQRAASVAAAQDAAARATAAQKAATDAAAGTAAAAKATSAFRTVQTALNRIGYGPVPVDGTANKATLDAIRGFELDNGLPLSGEPGEALIQRLIAIGAIKPN
jgi:peptidoglycan hydrolase-like protein with peptidoglycan-binding domain